LISYTCTSQLQVSILRTAFDRFFIFLLQFVEIYCSCISNPHCLAHSNHIQQTKTPLKHFSMAPPFVSRGRKRRRRREEEGSSFRQGDLGVREPQQGGTQSQRDNAHEPGAPFLSFVFI
jgi:hypothetical protein